MEQLKISSGSLELRYFCIENVSIKSFRLLPRRCRIRVIHPNVSIEDIYCWLTSADAWADVSSDLRTHWRPIERSNSGRGRCHTDGPSSSSSLLSDNNISNASHGQMRVFGALPAAADRRPTYPPIYDPTFPPSTNPPVPRCGVVTTRITRSAASHQVLYRTYERARTLSQDRTYYRKRQCSRQYPASLLLIVCLPLLQSYLRQKNIFMYLNRGDDMRHKTS